MAKNDVVLLDSFVQKSKTQFSQTRDDSELFEIFCFNQLLKDYEPTIEELESGWTDGGNDGGIDGLYVFVDQRIGTPDTPHYALKKHPQIDVHILSVRKSRKFEQQPLDALFGSLGELLDPTLSERELEYPYNETILQQRILFRQLFTSLADRQPLLRVQITYCCRGDVATVAPNILSRGEGLKTLLRSLFSNASIDMTFSGASELLSLARKPVDFNIRFPFSDTYITREGRHFILLCTLSNYFNAVRDDEGKLKRYLFEANVRDYLGAGQIAIDIGQTLARKTPPDQGDFWWLNNGVTIIGTRAQVVAKELVVENAQIVNGLQTTETLFRHFSAHEPQSDPRTILIKVISAGEDDIRGRIIKATNYQHSVELSSLRGLDKIQKDIEEFLIEHGWFYDRRKNFYKNQGKPAERIVSVPYLAAAVRAVALRDPAGGQRQRSKSLRDDGVYHAAFNTDWDLKSFLVCLEMTRAVELALNLKRNFYNSAPIALSHFIAYVFTAISLGKTDYAPDEVISLLELLPSVKAVGNK
jgi:AIPR protein